MFQKRLTKLNTEINDDLEEWKRAKQLLKPKDQLELADFVSILYLYPAIVNKLNY